MSQSSKTITVNILTIAIIETFSLLQSRIAIFLKYRADLILNFSRGVALAACIIKKQYIYRFRRKLVCLPKLVCLTKLSEFVRTSVFVQTSVFAQASFFPRQ